MSSLISMVRDKAYEVSETARQTYQAYAVQPQPQQQQAPPLPEKGARPQQPGLGAPERHVRPPSPSPDSRQSAQSTEQPQQAPQESYNAQPEPRQVQPKEFSLISMSPPTPASSQPLPAGDFFDLSGASAPQQKQQAAPNTANLLGFDDHQETTASPSPSSNAQPPAALFDMMDLGGSSGKGQQQQQQQQPTHPPPVPQRAPPPSRPHEHVQQQPPQQQQSKQPAASTNLLDGMDSHQSHSSDPFSDWMGKGTTTPNKPAEPVRHQAPAAANARGGLTESAMHDLLGPSTPSHSAAPQKQQQQKQHSGNDDMIQMGDAPQPSSGSDMISMAEGIQFTELQIEKKIGSGSFAEVFLCNFRGTPVAMKQLLQDRKTPANVADFKKEVAMLSRLRHPNIMMFVGANVTASTMFIITEYCPNGTLFNLLHQSNAALDVSRKVAMALDIARALAFLHGFQPPIIHRDIKTLNVLVDKNFNCKISDFGLAMSTYDATEKCGTYQFMAPELFSGKQQYNEKVDVYAFGILLWELVTRELPYAGMLGEQVPIAVERGHRPTIPDDCPAFLSALMRQCWSGDASSRPSMLEVVTTLQQVNNRMTQTFRGP